MLKRCRLIYLAAFFLCAFGAETALFISRLNNYLFTDTIRPRFAEFLEY